MKRKIDVPFIFISILVGLVLGVIMELVFSRLPEFGTIPYVITYIMVFAIIMGLVVMLKSIIGEAFVNLGKVLIFVLIGLIALGGCSGLFEYLYELGFAKTETLKGDDVQYIFLIDDSGSMRKDHGYNDGENDPDGLRFDAVGEIIRGMEPTDKFAVYAFSNSTKCITEFGSEESEDYEIEDENYTEGGGTYFLSAIQTAIDDVCDENNEDVHTKIIVLTDGEPQDAHLYDDVIDECEDNNVSVSSVGFGDAKESFLERLAEDTDGIFVIDQDLDALTENLETLVQRTIPAPEADRHLLGRRNDATERSGLYIFLRILFLTLLGIIWTVVKLLLVGEKKFMLKSAIWSALLCALAAIVMETSLLFTWGDEVEIPVRIAFAALWACTIIPEDFIRGAGLDNRLHTGRSNIGGTIADDFASKSNGGGDSKSFL